MKTVINKDESELDKMKRESLEWIERYGKNAPPFISVAVNAFKYEPLPKTERKSAEKTPEINEVKKWLSNNGIGTGTNITVGAVAQLIVSYYASQPSDVSDEDIKVWALCQSPKSNLHYVGLFEGAKAMRDALIPKIK